MMEQQTYSNQENEIKLRYRADQERLKTETDELKNEVSVKTAQRDELNRIAQEEADGTGGSKKRNAGPIYKLKKADADRVNNELQALVAKNDLLVKDKLYSLVKRDSTVQSEIAALAKQKLDGPASRMEALSRLTANSDAIWLANWFILFLFIAVETAPVFVKLISSQGPYDQLLRTEEHGFEAKRIEEMARINSETKTRTQDLGATETTFIKEELDIRLNRS